MKLLDRLKETVKDKRGNIEILMLLCCLVSVIAFSNFALAIITLDVGEKPENQTNIPSEKNLGNLKENKKIKEDELKRLEDKRRKLEAEIGEKKKELENKRELAKKTATNKKLEQRNQLNDTLIELEKQIQQKEKELEETRQSIERLKQAEKNEKDLKRLQDELERLKAETEAKKREFAKLNIRVDTSGEGKEKIEKEIQEFEKRKKELEEGLRGNKDVFNPWKDFLGTTDIKNPLFVECRKDSINLSLYNKTINISDLKRSNPFSDYVKQHDGIVLLVRPGAIETFNYSYQYVGKTNLKICYEPVDANWKLEFSR